MRASAEYFAVVNPDGTWKVEYSASSYHQTYEVKGGKERSEHEGEIAARIAIERDKCERRCAAIKAEHVTRFSVRA